MPLPEIILAKMLVPDSFRFTHSGFVFNLKNNFAPGSITSLKLISGGEEIPPSKVWFNVEDQPLQSTAEITSEFPAAFPTGLLVTITAEHKDPISTLILRAETREVGSIQLTVRKPSKSAQREPSWLVYLRKPSRLDIPIVNSTSVLDPALLGVFCSSPQSLSKGVPGSIIPPLQVIPLQSGADGDHWGKAPYSSDIAPDAATASSTSASFPIAGNRSDSPKQTKVIPMVNPCCQSGMDLDLFQSDPNAQVIIGGNAWQPWELSPESARIYAGKVDVAWKSLNPKEEIQPIGVLGKSLLNDDSAEAQAKWNKNLLEQLHVPIECIYWQVPPLAEWIQPGEISTSGWKEVFEQLTAMIDRMDALIDSLNSPHSIKQAVDFSKLISSLACEIRNHQTDFDRMDLAFVLFILFAACANRSTRLDFATLMDLSDLDLLNPPLYAAFDLLSGHFTRSQPGNSSTVNFAGLEYSPENSGCALVTSTKNGYTVNISVMNPQRNRRLWITLPEDLINNHFKILISSSQIRNGSPINTSKSRSSGTIHLNIDPRTLARFELSFVKE